MTDSIYTREYAVLLSMLRAARHTAGLTQEQLAECLSQTQSFVSKTERGERRLDVVELRAFTKALGIQFADFVMKLDRTLDGMEEDR